MTILKRKANIYHINTALIIIVKLNYGPTRTYNKYKKHTIKYMYVCLFVLFVSVYIYIYREREREAYKTHI